MEDDNISPPHIVTTGDGDDESITVDGPSSFDLNPAPGVSETDKGKRKIDDVIGSSSASEHNLHPSGIPRPRISGNYGAGITLQAELTDTNLRQFARSGISSAGRQIWSYGSRSEVGQPIAPTLTFFPYLSYPNSSQPIPLLYYGYSASSIQTPLNTTIPAQQVMPIFATTLPPNCPSDLPIRTPQPLQTYAPIQLADEAAVSENLYVLTPNCPSDLPIRTPQPLQTYAPIQLADEAAVSENLYVLTPNQTRNDNVNVATSTNVGRGEVRMPPGSLSGFEDGAFRPYHALAHGAGRGDVRAPLSFGNIFLGASNPISAPGGSGEVIDKGKRKIDDVIASSCVSEHNPSPFMISRTSLSGNEIPVIRMPYMLFGISPSGSGRHIWTYGSNNSEFGRPVESTGTITFFPYLSDPNSSQPIPLAYYSYSTTSIPTPLNTSIPAQLLMPIFSTPPNIPSTVLMPTPQQIYDPMNLPLDEVSVIENLYVLASNPIRNENVIMAPAPAPSDDQAEGDDRNTALEPTESLE